VNRFSSEGPYKYPLKDVVSQLGRAWRGDATSLRTFLAPAVVGSALLDRNGFELTGRGELIRSRAPCKCAKSDRGKRVTDQVERMTESGVMLGYAVARRFSSTADRKTLSVIVVAREDSLDARRYGHEARRAADSALKNSTCSSKIICR